MKKVQMFVFFFLVGFVLGSKLVFAQAPWEKSLYLAWSSDGIFFQPPQLFQDSAGVPSVVQWKGDTLICAFQWFRAPQNGQTWDKIALKFSYNEGLTWTEPVLANFLNYPSSYIRAFDPALWVTPDGVIRMYFSSKPNTNFTLDSLVDTYVAYSIDGINYNFSPTPVFGHPTMPVIDPSLIVFQNEIHYTAPVGAPQDGAYHAVSDTTDGINFTQQMTYTSNNNHQWTGNYCRVSEDTLRFYGETKLLPNNKKIWYKESVDGYNWGVNFAYTNLDGGDNSVIRLSPTSYLMIYVGTELNTSILYPIDNNGITKIYPNPCEGGFVIQGIRQGDTLTLLDMKGAAVFSQIIQQENAWIAANTLSNGVYIAKISNKNNTTYQKIVIYK